MMLGQWNAAVTCERQTKGNHACCFLEGSVESPTAEEVDVCESFPSDSFEVYAWLEHLVWGTRLSLVWFNLSHFLFNHPVSQSEILKPRQLADGNVGL